MGRDAPVDRALCTLFFNSGALPTSASGLYDDQAQAVGSIFLVYQLGHSDVSSRTLEIVCQSTTVSHTMARGGTIAMFFAPSQGTPQ